MANVDLELNPASHIAVGSVGQPGQRVFYLQAGHGDLLISLKLEKHQVSALAEAVDELVSELAQREMLLLSRQEESGTGESSFIEPDTADFAVGEMGLGYDPSSSMIVIVAQELVPDEESEPSAVRIWATVAQMRALGRQARHIVSKGRPICPLCHQPIDPTGHFCPRGNGHDTHHIVI